MLIDMPVSELFEYKGRNPRPEDFDAYWDKALEELDSTQYGTELVPAKFTCPSVDCLDLWYNGVRGARIHARYLRPKKTEKPLPAVFIFHCW
jgi:cephalosporin-C deacetylase